MSDATQRRVDPATSEPVIRHHPEQELLLAYAAGHLGTLPGGEAFSLILATHLAFCDVCRRDVALAERIGGVLLEDMAPAPLAADALSRTLGRLDGPATAVIAAASNDNKLGVALPAPLRAWLGSDIGSLRWRKMGSRLAYVPLLRRGQTRMRLLRGIPGADVGSHRHRGMEYTVVLAGGYTDVTGSYGPGDFQASPPDLKHNPVADPEGDCINLAVTTGPLVFCGLFQKIAGRFFGF